MIDEREESAPERSERSALPLSSGPVSRALTVEDIAARKAEAREMGLLRTVDASAVEEVPSRPVSAPVDQAAALRQARIGFFIAATLVLLFLWIRQRRKGG